MVLRGLLNALMALGIAGCGVCSAAELQGKVVSCRGEAPLLATIDVGTAAGLRRGENLAIYRDSANPIAHLRITSTSANRATGEVIGMVVIRAGDEVRRVTAPQLEYEQRLTIAQARAAQRAERRSQQKEVDKQRVEKLLQNGSVAFTNRTQSKITVAIDSWRDANGNEKRSGPTLVLNPKQRKIVFVGRDPLWARELNYRIEPPQRAASRTVQAANGSIDVVIDRSDLQPSRTASRMASGNRSLSSSRFRQNRSGRAAAAPNIAANVSVKPEPLVAPPEPTKALTTRDAALQEADRTRELATALVDRKDYQGAARQMLDCIAALRQATRLSDSEKERESYSESIASENHYTIQICALGTDQDLSSGISDNWRQIIEQLDPPREIRSAEHLVQADWLVHVYYATLQQHLSDYYVRREDYTRAAVHFTRSEEYFEKYEQLAPQDILNNKEQQHWRTENKKRLENLIVSRGLRVGMYVQNVGLLQHWFGRVADIDGDQITVSIIHASQHGSPEINKGQEYPFSRDQIQPAIGPSTEAIVDWVKSLGS